MSTKHTPGPWSWRNGFLTSVFDGKLDTATILENSEKVELSNANARLIASAPEMLNALENVLEEFKPVECNCDGEYTQDGIVGHACYFHRIKDELTRAIYKATGRRA